MKNENSILVDNAGVTKNVAKMWDDYAKSIGVTTNSLTQQQKIQAEVNGILEETKFQMSDAAKIANSFSGQVLQLQFNFNNLRVAIGNAIVQSCPWFYPSCHHFSILVKNAIDNYSYSNANMTVAVLLSQPCH